MRELEKLVHTPLAAALGWTLFHSLWEGAVLALVLLGTLGLARSSRVRYGSACLALLGILGAFAFTLHRILPESSATTVSGTITSAPHSGERLPGLSVPLRIADGLPWLTPLWMAGVLLLNLRSVADWLSARRLRTKGVCPVSDVWQRRFHEISARVGVSRSVTLLETCLAEVPVVIGYMSPVILIPVGLFVGMPARQMEAILIHELAHIRRHDYLANLL
jgi:bla regulator protein BlaR1